MSNTTPTPIQQIIEIIDDLECILICNHKMNPQRKEMIEAFKECLNNKLPAERKFAEECFDAGYEDGKLYMQEVAGRITPNQYNELSIDFTTFYKNNYEDGK